MTREQLLKELKKTHEEAVQLAAIASKLTPRQASTKEGMDSLTRLHFLKGKLAGLKFALR